MSETTTRETLGFQAEVTQLLHLMVHSLYGNKEIFLRELVSNASDAADKLRFEAMTDAALLEDDPDPRIRVSYDSRPDHHRVGQRHRHVATGSHRSHRHDRQVGHARVLRAPDVGRAKDAHLIGQFGVGFYSSFIVADRVTLIDAARRRGGRRTACAGKARRGRLHRRDRQGAPRHRRRAAPAAGGGRAAVGQRSCARSCASTPTTSPCPS